MKRGIFTHFLLLTDIWPLIFLHDKKIEVGSIRCWLIQQFKVFGRNPSASTTGISTLTCSACQRVPLMFT